MRLNRTIFLLSMLVLSFIPISGANPTEYLVDPNLIVLGETGNVVGTQFTVNITVSDAVELYALDLTFSWNTTYLDYVSHTPKIPVETYPDGVLHEPIIFLKDEVDTVAGTYWLAVSTLGGAPFNGSGTVFEMTLIVVDQPTSDEVPPSPNNYVSLPLLLDEKVEPSEDGEVRLYAIPPSYPPYPMVKVLPEVLGNKHINETFLLDVWLMGQYGLDLEPFFDVSGAETYLHFNSSLIEALNVTIDPDSWFASFWSTNVTEIAKEVNNTAGTVRVAFNASDGVHVPVHGIGRLFTVEFKVVSESSEWPLPSCVLGLKNPSPMPNICGVEAHINLEGYQHPERDYCPWNNSDSRVPLPHFVENATYHARYEPGVSVMIYSPLAKNYSREVLWLNVTANVPIEDWWYTINSGSNISFTGNTTINVAQCGNNLTVYASSSGMTGFSSIQFYALTGDFDEDRDVDIFDIVLLAEAYGSIIGEPAYNPEYDVDPPPFGDGDIDIFDVVTSIGDYGKIC